MADANAFLIYQDDNGVSNVNVRFEGEDACAVLAVRRCGII